jgi:general secretion pathway protein D
MNGWAQPSTPQSSLQLQPRNDSIAPAPALSAAPAEFAATADHSRSPSETTAKPIASNATLEVELRPNDLLYRHDRDERLVAFNLQDADLVDLVNHISGMTGKRFIYGSKIRQIKATVVSPESVTLEEAYEVFLSILKSNGMSVVPHGRFLKIVDTGGVPSQVTPVYGIGEVTTSSDRFLTRHACTFPQTPSRLNLAAFLSQVQRLARVRYRDARNP